MYVGSLHSHYHSVAHSLLAALPCAEVVTTNYDVLFEQAIKAAGEGHSSVPDAVPMIWDSVLFALH